MTSPIPEALPARPVGMQLRFSCPMCATVLEIPRARTGQEGPCPVCGSTIIAPSVVLTPSVAQRSVAPLPAPKVAVEPRLEPDEGGPSVPKTQTSRLCDLPPRPAFSARSAGTLPEETDKRVLVRRRKRRQVVTADGKRSLKQLLRQEFWLIALVLTVLAVGAAFAYYGDRMFSGIENSQPMHQR